MSLTSVLFVNYVYRVWCVCALPLFEVTVNLFTSALLLAKARHGTSPPFVSLSPQLQPPFIHLRHRNQDIVYMEWLRRGSRM